MNSIGLFDLSHGQSNIFGLFENDYFGNNGLLGKTNFFKKDFQEDILLLSFLKFCRLMAFVYDFFLVVFLGMKYSIFFSSKKRKKKEVFHLFWKKFISKDRNSMSILKDEKLHNY